MKYYEMLEQLKTQHDSYRALEFWGRQLITGPVILQGSNDGKTWKVQNGGIFTCKQYRCVRVDPACTVDCEFRNTATGNRFCVERVNRSGIKMHGDPMEFDWDRIDPIEFRTISDIAFRTVLVHVDIE